MAIPNSINYNDIPDALKSDVNSTPIVLNPVNSKATYDSGEIIIFDYTMSRGFIDPKSIYLPYKVTATNPIGATNNWFILGCPAYSCFLRCDTIINLQSIELNNQWNKVCNFGSTVIYPLQTKRAYRQDWVIMKLLRLKMVHYYHLMQENYHR